MRAQWQKTVAGAGLDEGALEAPPSLPAQPPRAFGSVPRRLERDNGRPGLPLAHLHPCPTPSDVPLTTPPRFQKQLLPRVQRERERS